MSFITDLTPLNFQEEKDRFLSNPTFNPQFRYVRSFTEEELLKYGFPTDDYLPLAQKIIDVSSHQFTPVQLQAERGALLSQAEVTKALEDFLKIHHLEKEYSIIWSEKFLSRAAVTNERTIKLRTAAPVYEEDLESLLYHEIGTHVLRRVNYEQQPWYKKKQQFGFGPHLRTEEGLATIHSLFPKKNISLAYRVALYYFAVKKAQEASFLDVWQLVRAHIEDLDFAFALTTKTKRGLPDTSLPGGFTKDIVYFEGFVETARFLIQNNFPIKELYFGKLAFQDIQRAKELNPDFEPLLPIFYTQNPEAYEQRMTAIAQTNFLI